MAQSKMGVTVHFHSPGDQRTYHLTLAVETFDTRHTAQNVQTTLAVVFADWGINYSKVSAIATDNGSNMVKAFNEHLEIGFAGEDEEAVPEVNNEDPTVDSDDNDDETETEDYQTTHASADILEFENQEQLLTEQFRDSNIKRIPCFLH